MRDAMAEDARREVGGVFHVEHAAVSRDVVRRRHGGSGVIRCRGIGRRCGPVSGKEGPGSGRCMLIVKMCSTWNSADASVDREEAALPHVPARLERCDASPERLAHPEHVPRGTRAQGMQCWKQGNAVKVRGARRRRCRYKENVPRGTLTLSSGVWSCGTSASGMTGSSPFVDRTRDSMMGTRDRVVWASGRAVTVVADSRGSGRSRAAGSRCRVLRMPTQRGLKSESAKPVDSRCRRGRVPSSAAGTLAG